MFDKAKKILIIIVIILNVFALINMNEKEEKKIERANRGYYSREIDENHKCKECGIWGARSCKYGTFSRYECTSCHENLHGEFTSQKKVEYFAGMFVITIVEIVVVLYMAKKDRNIQLLSAGVLAKRHSNKTIDFDTFMKQYFVDQKLSISKMCVQSSDSSKGMEPGILIKVYDDQFQIVVTSSEIALFGKKDAWASTCERDLVEQKIIYQEQSPQGALKIAKHWILSGTTKYTPKEGLSDDNFEEQVFGRFREIVMAIARTGDFELYTDNGFPFYVDSWRVNND